MTCPSLALSRRDIFQNKAAVFMDEDRLCTLCESCFIAGVVPDVMMVLLCGSGYEAFFPLL